MHRLVCILFVNLFCFYIWMKITDIKNAFLVSFLWTFHKYFKTSRTSSLRHCFSFKGRWWGQPEQIPESSLPFQISFLSWTFVLPLSLSLTWLILVLFFLSVSELLSTGSTKPFLRNFFPSLHFHFLMNTFFSALKISSSSSSF